MKRSLISLLIAMLFWSAYSQSLDRQVFGAAGDYSEGDGVSLSWTAGESFTETFTAQDLTLNQGFQQVYMEGPANNVIQKEEDFIIQVFPNPADDYLQLEWRNSERKTVYLSVTDLFGRTVKSISITNSKQIQIPTETLEPGTYILTIRTDDRTENVRFIKN